MNRATIVATGIFLKLSDNHNTYFFYRESTATCFGF